MDGMYSAEVESTRKRNQGRLPSVGDMVRYRGADGRFYMAKVLRAIGTLLEECKADLEVLVLDHALRFYDVRFDVRLNNACNTWHYGDLS